MKDTLKFIILACIFATPFICLYVAETMFFPFITGKNFTFRILVEVMLGAWVLLMFLDSSYRPKFSWILGAAGIFIAVLTVADLQGANPYKSFWSNYERMEGLITHAHLFLYFVIAGTLLAHEHMWKWFWRTSLGVSMIIAMHGFSQLAGQAEVHQSADRLDASLGNATYLAVYALFHLFLAVFLYFREGSRNSLRWLYLVIGGVNFVILYFTQTRGALLGVLGGAFLAFILVALFDREKPKWRKFAAGGVIGVVALVGLFIAFKDSTLIQSSPTLARMASISLNDLTTQSRFNIWSMSWEGFKERPILGWGQDNFLYVFSKHYIPAMWKQEPWFDRSHDVFFDWLIAAGALGLISYLSLFGAALYYIWFGRKAALSVVERAILTGMLAGYFVHNIFVFDNLVSYILFFGMLAWLHSLNAEEPAIKIEEQKQKHKHKHKHKDDEFEVGDAAIAGAVVLVLTAAMIYYVNIRNINANIGLINAIRPETVMTKNDRGEDEIAMKAILDRGLLGTTEAREQLIQLSMQTLDPRVPEDMRRKFYDLAASQVEDEIAHDPENLRIRTFAAMFYARFGQFDKSLAHFEKAIALSPTRQSTYNDLASVYFAINDYEKAEATAKISYDLDERNPDSVIAYVSALVYMRKFDEAEAIRAKKSEDRVAYDSRVVNAYGMQGAFDKVVMLVNEKIARGFAEARDYMALGGAYDELGHKEDAVAALEKAASLDASLKDQVAQLIMRAKQGQ